MRKPGGRIVVAAALFAVGLSPALPAAAAVPDTETTSCNGVLHGNGEGPLSKAFVSELNNGDGTFTLTYRITSPRPDGIARVRDCAWVDTDGNGQWDGEPLFGTDDKDVLFVSGTAEVDITVTVAPGQTVCDRVARSADNGPGDYTDKSNVLCHLVGEPPPVIPEAPLALLLPLTGAALLGAAAVRRRTRPALPGVRS